MRSENKSNQISLKNIRILKIYIFLQMLSMTMHGRQADITRIAGIFLYQRNIEASIGYYENTLVEDQPKHIGSTITNSNGDFVFEFLLDSPKLIIFSFAHDVLRIYCQPGDSIYLEIVNRQNIIFTGDHNAENNLLFSEGLSTDIIRISSNDDLSIEEKSGIILTTFQERLAFTKSQEKLLDDDFTRLFIAESIGRKYSELFRALSKGNREHYPELYAILDSFGKDTILDESRSRSYNNCFASFTDIFLQNQYLNLLPQEQYDGRWYHNLDFPEKTVLLDLVRNYPNLYQLLSYSSFNNMIYLTNTTTGLDSLVLALESITYSLPNEYLLSILRERLVTKIRKLKLQKPYDFVSESTSGDKVLLSDFRKPLILIDFWATWCKPCIENMSKMDEFAFNNRDSIVVLAINIGDSKANWKNYLSENNFSNLIQLKLNHDESTKVFAEYYFDSVPNYILLNYNLEFVIKGVSKFDPAYIKYLLQTISN